jgi:hypothetical protein
MKALRRILAVCLLLLSVAGLVLSIVGSVKVWPITARLKARLDRGFQRIDELLELGKTDLGYAQNAIVKSREGLKAFKEAPAPTSKDARGKQMVIRTMAPQLANMRTTMSRVAETSVALQGILDEVSQLPLGPAKRPDGEKLRDAGELLGTVQKTAQSLSVLLPEKPDAEPTIPDPQKTLDDLEQLVIECQGRLENFSERVGEVKTTADHWAQRGPWLVTVGLLWVALGQVCMFLVGCRLLRSPKQGSK